MDDLTSLSRLHTVTLLKWTLISLTAAEECSLPYDRCPYDPCPSNAPLMCNHGRTCVDESLICDDSCNACNEPECLDESPTECSSKKFRTLRKLAMIGGGLLAIPLIIIVSYYFCCGGKRKRNRLMGSILSDHTSQHQQQQGQQTEQQQPQNELLTSIPLRNNSIQSARSRSNSAAESLRSESSRSLRTNRSSGHNLRRQRQSAHRTYGIDNVLEPFLSTNRCSTRSLGHQSRSRDLTRHHHCRDHQVGGSLRLPSPRHRSRSHHEDDDGAMETYFRFLADAPPSYSDSCLSNQSEAARRSRDLLTVESGEEPPPSYREVLEKKFPLFGSHNEIRSSTTTQQGNTSNPNNDVTATRDVTHTHDVTHVANVTNANEISVVIESVI